MQHRSLSRFLSAILVIALLIQMLPLQAVSALENSSETAAEPSETVTIVGEEAELRGMSEKHFRLSDGSYIAVSYGAPVHFIDEEGNWQDIDNSPVMVSDATGEPSIQIAYGDKCTNFSSGLTDGMLFTTSLGDVSVSMQLLDTAQAVEQLSSAEMSTNSTQSLNISVSTDEYQVFSRNATADIVEGTEPAVTSEEENGWQMSDVMPENLSTSIVYEDVFDGVDLRYEAYSYHIKEEIIIREAQESYRYDFLLTLNGLTAQLNEDGSVDLFNAENIAIYRIPAPYMVDGAGALSEKVEYSLMQTEDGVILTVVADEEWINHSEREFPVTIDPTLSQVVYTSNNGESQGMYVTHVKESNPSETAQGTDLLYVGYGIQTKEMQAYIHVNTLPEIPAGSVVTQASLTMCINTYDGVNCSQLPLGLYEVDSSASTDGQSYFDWIRYMSWSTKPGYISDNMIDYAVLSANTIYYKNNHGPLSWDMTELVKKWYREGTENRTVALAVTSDKYSSNMCAIATIIAGGTANGPSFVVSYRSNTGIEPYYTYTTLGVGSAGTAYIADATGQLKIGKQLVGYASSVNPFALNLVYNSDYFASAEETDHHPLTADLGLQMAIGSGWRLDCVQKIVPVDISGTTYLKYFDGDGTIHYFVKDASKGTKYYYDEDGLGLKIENTGTNAYKMSDDYGNTWVFTNNVLTEASDETGNKILYKYTGSQLTSVVQKNAGCSEITVATLTYSGTTLLSVTDAADNKYTFSYNGSKLIAIQLNGTTIAQYGYSGYRVSQMTDYESGYSISFHYSKGNISKFWETAGGATGATVDVTYPNSSQTTYRDYGANRTAGDSDDIRTHYLFDYAGRTVNAYTTDAAGNVIGASNAVYTGSGSTDKTNNRTLRTASIGAAGQQLMRDTSFELNSGWTLSGLSRGQSNPRTGLYALQGTLSAAGTQYAQRTSEALTAGKTYTFSAYVDTSAVTSFAGQGVYLQVTDGSNTWKGEPVNYKTSAAVNDGWVRISVTFTAVSSKAHTVSVRNDGSIGTFYADDLQLELGEAPSNYNLVENGSLEMSTHRWTLSSAASVTNTGDTDYSVKITGSPANTAANAYQTITVNLPGTETYVLSGWVCANAVPDNANTAADTAQDVNKQCGLRAVVHYSNSSTEYHYVPFNADLDTWQFVSYTIVPKKQDLTVSEIVIYCAYEGNANTAQFDDISLVRQATQTMTYDADGNLTSVTSTGLSDESYSYENGNLIEAVTGGQGTYDYTYDTTYTHRLTSVTNGLITQTMGYDSVGNVNTTTLTGSDGLFMKTSAVYGNNGNLLSSVTDAAGAQVTYKYDSADNLMYGLPSSVTAPNGTVTSTGYDDYGRATQINVDDLATLMYNYEKGNLKSIQRTANGKTQTYGFTYDEFGNTKSIKVGSQTLASYTYAAGNGNLTRQTYGNGDTVSFTYDNLGRAKTVTYTSGRKLTYTYTGDGQLYSVTESGVADPATYLYQYDSLGQLVGSEKIVGDTSVLRTYQHYNKNSQITLQGWQIGSSSFSQSYTYDSGDGSLTAMTLPGGQNLTYGYDSLRRLSTIGNGLFTRQYTYSASGNQTSTQVSRVSNTGPASSFAYGYTYDSMGNIKTYTAPDGEVITYTYDAQGQLLKAAGDTTYTYTYDAAGNLLTASDGTTTHTYTYGNSDWKDLLTAYDGQSITYDTIGNPTSYFNGTRWSFTWGEGRQLTTASTTTGAEDVTVAYTYGADGIRTSKTVTAKTYHTHSYTSTVVLPTCEESGYTNYVCVCGYSYQDNVTAATGHSYTETVTAPTCTERGYTTYTCACGYSYTTYTAALGHDFPDDVVGVLARTCTRCGYQQGISTKPVQPILPPGSGSTTGDDEIVDLTGSENGAAEVMAASETDERTQESTVMTKYDYIYLGSQLVQMTVTTTVDNGTPTTKTLNFAYDASGTPATVTYDGAIYYYITNLQGDVMAILNSSGTAVVQYEYDPWGNILATTGTMATTLGEVNPLRYRGYVYDTETQLYYLQSRYFDSKTCRFLNADVLISTDQGILGYNMFAYCSNNPVNYNDPTGHRRKFWYTLFQEHQPGYIHTKVQLHILAVYNAYEVLYRKEFVIPGIGRADLVKPSTGEVWEIKHGGSSLASENQGIKNALDQLGKYVGESTGLHPGSAGEFSGFFTINYEDRSYAVIYLTPDAGVVLYYLLPIERVKKSDYVYIPSSVSSTSESSNVAALGLLLLPIGGGGRGLEKAYAG